MQKELQALGTMKIEWYNIAQFLKPYLTPNMPGFCFLYLRDELLEQKNPSLY